MRRSASKLKAHLRENGLRKTVRDLPALVRRRMGYPEELADTKPAGPARGKVFVSDPWLPNLRVAVDPELMREVFQRYAHLLIEGDSRVLECRVDFAAHRPSQDCTLYYTVRLEEGSRQVTRQVTGVMYPNEWDRQLQEDIEAAERYTNRRVPGSLAGSPAGIPTGTAPFFYVPDLNMLAQIFPHDYRLPALSTLIAGPPSKLEELLLSQFRSGDWRVEAWNAEPVRYWTNSRATLRLTMQARDHLSGRTEERHYYAKVYRWKQRARQTHRVLRQLHERASAGGDTLKVARPVAHLGGLQTTVQEEVSGTPLDELLRREEDPSWAMRKVARGLAHLHLSDVVPPRRRRLQNETALLETARERLRSASPHLASDVEEVFDAIVNGLQEVPPSPTHGDLRSTHLVLEGDRFTLLDLDTFMATDPVQDVAHLSYTLAREMAPHFLLRGDTAQSLHAQSLVRTLVEEYFACVPESWYARLPFQYASVAFKKAALSVRLGMPSWPQHVEVVLEEARHSLTGKIW